MAFSRKHEIPPVTFMTTEGEGDCTVGSTMEGPREDCSMLSVCLELDSRRVREENSWLAAVVN